MRNSCALVLIALAFMGGCAHRQARDVVLVATGMSFALASAPGAANPALAFRPGERIRLTIKNEAPGLRHDVAIPAWNVATEQVGFGETAQVIFTVPQTDGPAGLLIAARTPRMMRGRDRCARSRSRRRPLS